MYYSHKRRSWDEKELSFWLGILVFSLAFAGIASASTLDEIKARGKIIIGTDATYPYGVYDESGEIVGFDIDLGKAIAEN